MVGEGKTVDLEGDPMEGELGRILVKCHCTRILPSSPAIGERKEDHWDLLRSSVRYTASTFPM